MPGRAGSPAGIQNSDREVIDSASSAFVPGGNKSPRRRWSLRSNSNSPRRSPSPRRGVNTSPRASPRLGNWTSSVLPGATTRLRKNYEELVVDTEASEEERQESNSKENSNIEPTLSLEGIPVPHPASVRKEESPKPIHRPIPKPRFSLGKLQLPANQTRHENDTNKRVSIRSTTTAILKPSQSGASQIFRQDEKATDGRSEALLTSNSAAGIVDSRDDHDDFDSLIKQRQNMNLSVNAGDQTELHEICGNMCTVDDVLRAKMFLTGNPDCSCKKDARGRTPLHILSTNKILAAAVGVPSACDGETTQYFNLFKKPTFDQDSHLENHLVRFLVEDLLASNPWAMTLCDDNGDIPFEEALIEWVKESHQGGLSNEAGVPTATNFSYSTAMSQVWDSTVKIGRRTSMMVSNSFHVGTPKQNPDLEGGDESRSAILFPAHSQQHGESRKASHKDQLNDKSLPGFVRLTSRVRFSIAMLSAIVDQLDRYCMSPELLQRRFQTICHGVKDATVDRAKTSLDDFHEHFGALNIISGIIETMARIPDLMKTILLIHSDEDRNFALNSSIIRRIMVDRKSVGPWVTQVLQSRDRILAQRAVAYLKTVSSNLTQQPKGGPTQKLDRNGEVAYDLIDEVSRLQDFIPSLLALGDRGIEDASTTFVVKKVLDRMISRPFAVTVILCDAIFLSILIIGFRTAVNRIIEGAALDTVLKCIYVANTGIFYFIIREIGKTVSLFLIAKRSRKYFFSFWNLTDLLAIVFALVSTITMRYHFTVLENGLEETKSMRVLLAISTGFLWLRVLSLLKAINMQLATFVLAILQITKDILWFCVILLTLVVSFSQMFYTLLAPQSCAVGNGSDMECKSTEYLLRVYTILLGDFGNFERDQFKTGFSVFLVVFYSFLVTVVLLNVLIAIASDSYEKCLLRSQHLFGRARVMLVAELVSFQSLLKFSGDERASTPKQGLRSHLWSSSRWFQGWSHGSILFFSLSSAVISGWTVAELLGYASGEQYSNILFSLASVIVNVGLFAAIMLFLTVSSKKVNQLDDKDRQDGIVQRAMLNLLGAPRTDHDNATGRDGNEWKGRVHYLQEEMNRIADEHRELASHQAQVMENLVNQSESRLKAEIESLEDHFASLKKSLLDEVRGTKRTNQNVSIAIEELKNLLSVAASSEYRSPVPSEVDIDNNRVLPHGKRP